MGVAQWEKAYVTLATDGELMLVVPGFYDAIQAQVMRNALPGELREVLGGLPSGVTVEEATRDRQGNYSGSLGSIAIFSLAEPWPDATRLRTVIDEIIARGQTFQDKAEARVEGLRAHLSSVFR